MVQKHNNYGKPVVYKSFATEIKADVENRKVSGYLAAFGNKDSDDDIIVKGAFAKSISDRGVSSSTDRKIAYLWQHDMKEPVGKFTTLLEDDKGLYFEADVSKIELGDRLLAQYADGTLNQHSIGFRYVWDKIEYDDVKEAYIVKEVNLFEGSVVTMGANENTPFTGFKSEQIETEKHLLDRDLETFLKKFSKNESYKVRQLISNYIEINKQEPFNKDTLKNEADSKSLQTFINQIKI